jgi:hypothetical protein
MAMNSRTVLNVALVLAVAVLAAVVYFQPGLKEEPVGKLLTAINPQQVKELRLSNEQGEVVLWREGDEWSLQSPLTIASNKFRVEQLLHWFTVSSVQSYAAAGLDLAKFGLDQPQAIVSADGVELRFGSLDPLNQRRYVLLNDTVHLVAESDLTAPTSPWNYFVSPLPVPPGAQIKSIAIPGLGEITQGDKGWRYSGKTPPTSADAMQMMVDSWRNARALSVEPVMMSDAHEQVVISFVGDRPPLTLMLLRSEDDLVLVADNIGIEYHMGVEQGGALLMWPESEKVEAK